MCMIGPVYLNCLSVHLSVRLSVRLSVCLLGYQLACLLVSQLVKSVSWFVCQPLGLLVNMLFGHLADYMVYVLYFSGKWILVYLSTYFIFDNFVFRNKSIEKMSTVESLQLTEVLKQLKKIDIVS